MGLDASVYKNLRSVSESLREQVILIDAETGEIDYKKHLHGAPEADLDSLYAIEIRIGNISAVAELRGEVGDRLPGRSILMDEVLYSGSHAGDFIPFDQLDELEREVNLIRASPGTLPSNLQTFLGEMSMLIDTARRERNPIVF
jgi:hypothetical protein